jgi:hypothetical protein
MRWGVLELGLGHDGLLRQLPEFMDGLSLDAEGVPRVHLSAASKSPVTPAHAPTRSDIMVSSATVRRSLRARPAVNQTPPACPHPPRLGDFSQEDGVHRSTFKVLRTRRFDEILWIRQEAGTRVVGFLVPKIGLFAEIARS